jgi:hypothetical protein
METLFCCESGRLPKITQEEVYARLNNESMAQVGAGKYVKSARNCHGLRLHTPYKYI